MLKACTKDKTFRRQVTARLRPVRRWIRIQQQSRNSDTDQHFSLSIQRQLIRDVTLQQAQVRISVAMHRFYIWDLCVGRHVLLTFIFVSVGPQCSFQTCRCCPGRRHQWQWRAGCCQLIQRFKLFPERVFAHFVNKGGVGGALCFVDATRQFA